MEKLETKVAEKLFDDVDAQFEEYNTVEYGASKTPVKIHKNLSIGDMRTIVNFVIDLAFDDDKYDYIKRETGVATAVVKFLTDIPKITTTDDEGEELEDVAAYYQIVFGDNGLYDRRKNSYWIINKIEHYIDQAVEVKKEELKPLNQLCSRIMELGAAINAELDDFLNNPANIEQLENVISMATAKTNHTQN